MNERDIPPRAATDSLPTDDADRRHREREENEMISSLKHDINAFLWPRLPGGVTLDQADEVALAVYGLITRAWDARRSAARTAP